MGKPAFRSIKEYSRSFSTTRRQHLKEAAEDYTELIAELITQYGEARVGTVARCLGVSHVTALRTIERLRRDGLVTGAKHAPLLLTPAGSLLAKRTQARHIMLVDFFCSIGVPRRIAEIDVEGVEHHISVTSLRCIKDFLKNQ